MVGRNVIEETEMRMLRGSMEMQTSDFNRNADPVNDKAKIKLKASSAMDF